MKQPFRCAKIAILQSVPAARFVCLNSMFNDEFKENFLQAEMDIIGGPASVFMNPRSL